MASKKAPSTIIKEQAAEIDRLNKELTQAKSRGDSYYKESNDRQRQIDEIHTMLDVLPTAPARRTEPHEGSYRQPVELTLIARLSVWIANLEARQ